MRSTISLWLSALLLSAAQTFIPLPSPLGCAPGSPASAAPSCDFFFNSTIECKKLHDVQSARACGCDQKIFNAAFDCESELRLCYESDVFDHDLDQAVSLLHSVCDSFITYSTTTPAVSSITLGYDYEFCGTVIHEVCVSAADGFKKCSTLQGLQALSSCSCQPSLLRQVYTCEYVGNSSCLSAPAATSNLYGFAECSDFSSVIGASLPRTTEFVSLPPASGTPASPGSSVSSSVSPTTSSLGLAISRTQGTVYQAGYWVAGLVLFLV